MSDLPREFFEEEEAKRIRQGHLLSMPGVVVITVKTGGRAYSRISKEAVQRGIEIPDIPIHTAKLVGRHIFVCLWGDEGDYTPEGVAACAAACLRVATLAGLKSLTLPMLGGNRSRELLWAAEKGIFEETERLEDEENREVPEHI